jgi:hypothetical protein
MTPEIEVFLRVIDLNYLGDAALEEPVVIATTFFNGRMAEREIYDPHGELLTRTELPA